MDFRLSKNSLKLFKNHQPQLKFGSRLELMMPVQGVCIYQYCYNDALSVFSLMIIYTTGEDKREKGKLYIPGKGNDEKTTAERAQEYAKMLASDTKKDTLSLKKKSQEKKKSNLELFKEELRQ